MFRGTLRAMSVSSSSSAASQFETPALKVLRDKGQPFHIAVYDYVTKGGTAAVSVEIEF